jgi:hypothetical protein
MQNGTNGVRFEVLTQVTMKNIWDMMPYSSVEVHRRFGGTYCLRLYVR